MSLPVSPQAVCWVGFGSVSSRGSGAFSVPGAVLPGFLSPPHHGPAGGVLLLCHLPGGAAQAGELREL